jgi:putative transposase
VGSNVPVAEATLREGALPERVREALGALVGAAKEGLLALSVGVGLSVLTELMDEEVNDVVGPKGKWNRERTAVRHGHEDGEVTLGGRRVEVKRPRVRTADGESEVPLQTYQHFADRDPLGRVVLERMLAGVSARRYRRTQEPVGEQVEITARSTSKSAVSRAFVQRTPRGARRADEPTTLRSASRGDDARRPGAQGSDDDRRAGNHHRGCEDPARAVGRIDRERDRRDRAAIEPGRAPPGSRARNAVRDRRIQSAAQSEPLGVRRRARPEVYSHKERNVMHHLPERDRPPIKARLRRAWAETGYHRALDQLRRLADELEHTGRDANGEPGRV